MSTIKLGCGCRYERENGLNVFVPCARHGSDGMSASAIESSLENLTDQLEELYPILDATTEEKVARFFGEGN